MTVWNLPCTLHLRYLLDEVAQSGRKLFFVSNLSKIIEFSEEVKQLLMKRDVEQIMMVYSANVQLSLGKWCHTGWLDRN